MLQISEVAARGKEVEQRSWRRITEKSHGISSQAIFTSKPISDDDLKGLIAMTNAEKSGEDVSQNDTKSRKSSGEQMGRVIDPDDENPYTGGFSSLQRSIIAELLGQREELGRGPTTLDSVPVSALLQFRRALATMATDFPFGGDFGIAVTRGKLSQIGVKYNFGISPNARGSPQGLQDESDDFLSFKDAKAEDDQSTLEGIAALFAGK